MVKSIMKRWLSLIVAIAMVAVMLPATAVQAAPGTSMLAVSGELADPDIGVAITGDGTAEAVGSEINASITGEAGCNGSGTSKSTTLTIKNNKSEAAVLSFVYEPIVNGGSVKLNNTNVTAKGTFSEEIAAAGTVSFTLASAADNKTTSVKITEIKLIVEKNVTTTFKPGENGTYTVDGATIDSETTKTQSSTQAFAMTATPASGYKFFGWKSETTGKFVSNTANASLMLDSDQTIYPVFISKETALFSTNGAMFYDLNEAVKAAASDKNKRIVLAETGTLAAGDYNIPAGYTLLIPFDAAGTCYTTTPGVLSNSYTKPSAFRTLTMAEGANITVNGAISVSAKQTSGPGGQDYAGAPSGPYGYIKMSAGSTITCNNGAKLYAWGYISGDGTVTMKSGSTVYEDMQIGDFRGGSASSSLVRKARGKAFLFNQYFIQNVESLMVIEAGATEKLYTSLYASSMTASSDATFIGPNGMFNITNGTFTKKYNPATDRLEVTVNGEATIDSITVKVMSNSLDSGSYVLPITNNMSLDVQSGTTHLTQDIQMLAGVKVNVANGATLDIASNSDIFLFDHDEWAGKNFAQYEFRSVSYSPTKSYTRKSSDLTDVKLDVNGTVDVKGHLYTTAGGADICSSEGTGVINMISGAGTATQTYQVANAESDVTAVPITSAKLHNGCDDPVYTETVGAVAGTVYTYNKAKDMWVNGVDEYTVTFDANEGTGTMEPASVKDGESYTVPECAFTRENYEFVEWKDADEKAYKPGDVIENITSDMTLSAQWNGPVYTVTWVNEDGTVLETDKVKENETPAYSGETPTKAATAEYTYTFAGWTPEVSAVIAPVTYKATYTETKNSYPIHWVDENGITLAETTVEYGETPVYPNAEPTKEADATNTYTFAGWKNGESDIVPVTGEVTYKATYTSEKIPYTITWDVDGVPETQTYGYGETPSHADPVKTGDAQYSYVFKGWSPEIGTVKGNQTYTANFEQVVNKYTVTWKNGDEVLKTEEVAYGDMAVYSGETPVKERTDQYTYTFTGWDNELPVTEDVTYTAMFEEKLRTYTITWTDDEDNVLKTNEVEYGTMPSFGDENPVKEATAEFTYEFKGWTPEIVEVKEATTYKAEFTETKNKYTVTWVNNDGTTEIASAEYEYGAKPEYPAGPAAPVSADEHYTYTFAGWNKEVAEVTENVTIMATFDPTPKSYTITWEDEDGTQLAKQVFEYGSAVEYPGEAPAKDGYKFVGWTPEMGMAEADATYTAVFEKVTQISFMAIDPRNPEKITTLTGAEIADGSVIAQPTAPSYTGYDFMGWSVKAGDRQEMVEVDFEGIVDTDELNEKIAEVSGADLDAVEIYAVYEQTEATYTMKIIYNVNKTEVSEFTTEAKVVGTALRLSATDTYTDDNGNSYVFDHWLIGGVEYSASTVTTVPKSEGKYTAVAYYVVGEEKASLPTVDITDAFAETVNDVNKVAIQMSYNVPSAYTLVESGIVYSTKVAEPSISNGTKGKCNLNTPDGAYILHIKVGTKVDTKIYARAYVTYKDANGETNTIYSKARNYTWNKLH